MAGRVDGRDERVGEVDRRPRRSTGARVLRWLVLAVLFLAVVALLFEVVFPWFEVNYYDPSIGG